MTLAHSGADDLPDKSGILDGFSVDDLNGGVDEADPTPMDEGPVGGAFGNDSDDDLGGTDSDAASGYVRASEQGRGEDGKFQAKDSRIPKKTPPETDEEEIRRVLGEEGRKPKDEDGNSKPDKKKPVDKTKAKAKDEDASEDPAETESGETTDDGDTEQVKTKLSRKARADAEKALLLDKWTKSEIAELSDTALTTAAKKATDRHAEIARTLEAAKKQTAKNGVKDPARKAETTEDDDAEADEDDAELETVLSKFADEAYDEHFDDPSGKFKTATTAYQKKVVAHLEKRLETRLADIGNDVGEQVKKIVEAVKDDFTFNLGADRLRAKFGQHMKDQASLDSLKATAKALYPKTPTSQEALNAAARALWAGKAVDEQIARQQKINDAKRHENVLPSGRSQHRGDPDDVEVIRTSLRRGGD